MLINDPATIAELKALYPAYEAALVSNDVEVLTHMFWDSPEVMRFGVTENLYGTAEIEAFRKSRPSKGLARTVTRLDIVSFGTDYGSITLEFERTQPATETNPEPKTIRGRQSQAWVRLAIGWRIVSAHVSLLP